MNPEVTVVIPAKNAVKYIGESIRSVLEQQRDVDGIEILVVDHASNDDTSGEVSRVFSEDRGFSPEIRLLHAKGSGGPGHAKNIGLQCARGRFISFHDADDVMVRGSLFRRIETLKQHPEASAVFGRIETLIDSSGSPFVDLQFSKWINESYEMAKQQPLLSPKDVASSKLTGYATLVYKLETIVKVGNFDVELPQAEDFDYAYRAARVAPIIFCDTPSLWYRVHGENSSIVGGPNLAIHARAETRTSHLRALRKHGLA